MRTTPALLGAALALTVAAPAVAQRSHLGVHGGYNFDVDEALVGAQIHFPVAWRAELYPSFDYYFVDAGSLVGFAVDLKLNGRFRNPLYIGGGLSFLRTGGGGTSNTDTGADFFLGLESRRGLNHPFVELRLLLHDDTSLQLAAGLNFTLF